MKPVIGAGLPAIDIFWGEIAPCDHLVQIYEEDDVFLDSVEGFVAGGLRAGDGVVAIATDAHLAALDERLTRQGVGLDFVRSTDQYIALNAEKVLGRFMVAGWPDEELFETVISELLLRARGAGRRVRAFGEMVAVLWARGQNSATLRLEHLWHKLCQNEAFSLFCAYPKCGFTKDAQKSIEEICAAHSRIVPEFRGRVAAS
jgi:hypothetical protein